MQEVGYPSTACLFDLASRVLLQLTFLIVSTKFYVGLLVQLKFFLADTVLSGMVTMEG
jgi:hypothetical protein